MYSEGFDGFLPVGGFSGHDYVLLALNNSRNSRAQERVVIDGKNRDFVSK
jgi:hypothetical protein